MIKKLKEEMRVVIRNRITLIVLLAMLFISFLFFHSLPNKAEYLNERKLTLLNAWTVNMEELRFFSYDKESAYYKLIEKRIDSFEKSLVHIDNSDLKSMMIEDLYRVLIELTTYENYYTKLSGEDQIRFTEYFTYFENIQEIKKKLNFNQEGIDHIAIERIKYYDNIAFLFVNYPMKLLMGNHILLKSAIKGHPSALLEYCRKIMPFISVISILLITSFVLRDDFKMGAIKTILNIDGSRLKFILRKMLSCSLISIMIVILPIIIYSIINFSPSYINDMNQEIFYYKNTFTSTEPVFHYTNEMISSSDNNNYQSILQVNLNKIVTYDTPDILSLMKIDSYLTISVLPTILLCISMQFLIMLFISLLAILITILLKKDVFSIIIITTIIVILSGLANVLFGDVIGRLNPLAYLNTVAIIEGSIPITYLSGIINIVLIILLLFSITVRKFKKTDI